MSPEPKSLRIERDLPVDFQEAIRSRYPITEEQKLVQLELRIEDSAQQPFARPIGKHFNFLTADRTTTIGLTPEFVSITTTKYSKWEEFSDDISFAMNALFAIYNPSIVSRIGLRYQNIIDREELGLDCSWQSLLSDNIDHPFGRFPTADASIIEYRSAIRVNIEQQGQNAKQSHATVFLQHGLVTKQNANRLCYMVDADFSDTREGKPDASDLMARLKQFNYGAGACFNWAISDFLREKLEPLPVDI